MRECESKKSWSLSPFLVVLFQEEELRVLSHNQHCKKEGHIWCDPDKNTLERFIDSCYIVKLACKHFSKEMSWVKLIEKVSLVVF